MSRTRLILTAAIVLLPSRGSAEAVPFDSPRWEIRASESERVEHLGRPALRIKGGAAWVNDSEFTNGVIEFDMAVGPERGFMGGLWHMQSPGEREEFYVRPHQSGNPDANQYTPVFHGLSAWQLYHGAGYGAPVDYPFNEWFSVRILVSDSRAEVYLFGSEEPALFIPELKRSVQPGHAGVFSSNFSPAWYSNFRFTRVSSQRLKSRPAPARARVAGTVTSWRISRSFPEAALDSVMRAGIPSDKAGAWTKLDSEPTGITNLARVQGIDEGNNTAIARIRVTSSGARVVSLQLGYSDRATVFVNGRRLYSGDNTYQSRDYRYLGTIGLFDTVYLPLENGANDVSIAVAESFGGWGLMARFPDLQGITID